MSDDIRAGSPAISDTRPQGRIADPAESPGYGAMVDALRDFLDAVAAAKPNEEILAELTGDLTAWKARLAPLAVDEQDQVFARRPDLPCRGQTMWPAFHVACQDERSMRGTVWFGRYFLGGHGAAHGGAITLFFDEILGRFSNLGGRPRARSAYLNTNFRAVTPLETELDVRVEFVSEVGRKRLLRGEIWHGDVLCAEADLLLITLRAHQP